MSRNILGILILFFVLGASVPMAAAQQDTSNSDDQQASQNFVGTWGWFNPDGSTVEIRGDGTTVHFNNDNVTDSGQWVPLEGGGIRISWDSGFTDEWHLSDDNNSMSGSNQYGPLQSVARE